MLRRFSLLALMSLAAALVPSAHAQCNGKIVVSRIDSMNYRNIQIYKLIFTNKSTTPVLLRLGVINPPADFVADSLPSNIRMGVGNPLGRNLGQGGVHNFSVSNVKIVYDDQPAPSSGFAISLTGCKVVN